MRYTPQHWNRNETPLPNYRQQTWSQRMPKTKSRWLKMKSDDEMELEKKKTSMEIELEFELSQEEERMWTSTLTAREKRTLTTGRLALTLTGSSRSVKTKAKPSQTWLKGGKMSNGIPGTIERKINAWCERHGVSITLPLSQKETLRELYYNPCHVPSEEIFLAMLKSTPIPTEHKRSEHDNFGLPLQAGWKKTWNKKQKFQNLK